MPSQKIRLVDTDVISNILVMNVRSDLSPELPSSLPHFKLWTTNIVANEIKNRFREAEERQLFNSVNIRSEEIPIFKRAWTELKRRFILKNAVEDPSALRNRGEMSLVDVLPVNERDVKIVSNNKSDVYRYLRAKVSRPSTYYQSPFEFYEQMSGNWFNNYKDLLRFLILSNHDFKVIEKAKLGNILRRVR